MFFNAVKLLTERSHRRVVLACILVTKIAPLSMAGQNLNKLGHKIMAINEFGENNKFSSYLFPRF